MTKINETHHHRSASVTKDGVARRETIAKNPDGKGAGYSATQGVVEGHGDALMGLIQPEEEIVEAAPAELTAEERMESASLLNRLMGGQVVDDMGRPLDEQSARLFTIKTLIESLKIRVDDDGEVDDIVFAMESPEWTSRSFTRKEHFPWAALGLGPEIAARWRDSGFTPYNVGDWVTGYGSRVEPEQARHYHEAGIPPKTGREWNSYSFEGEDAVKWIQANIDVYEASRWRNAGIPDVDEARDWVALGIEKPDDAGILKSLGSEASQRWLDAGVENFRAALSWNKYVKAGYTEQDLAPFVNGDVPVSADVFEGWQKESVPADQIATFLEKGYTPKRAVSRIKKGKTAAQAEDLRAGEVVPGKAWKELKAGIQKSARISGCKATYTESRNRGDYGVTVDIELSPSDDSGRGGYKRYRMRFTNTGRFISAEGTRMYRQVRKVSDVLDVL